METHDLMADAIHFGIAVLLGALVGIEREKHRRERKPKTEQIAGLRTFILFALLGACTAWLSRVFESYWIVAAGLLITGAFVVAGYRQAAGEPLRWLFEWGSTWKVVAAGLVGMYTLGVVASVSALRRAESDAARRRARVFLLAFGTRDVVWGGIYLIAMLAGDTITPTQLAWIAQAYAGSLLVYALLVGMEFYWYFEVRTILSSLP